MVLVFDLLRPSSRRSTYFPSSGCIPARCHSFNVHIALLVFIQYESERTHHFHNSIIGLRRTTGTGPSHKILIVRVHPERHRGWGLADSRSKGSHCGQYNRSEKQPCVNAVCIHDDYSLIKTLRVALFKKLCWTMNSFSTPWHTAASVTPRPNAGWLCCRCDESFGLSGTFLGSSVCVDVKSVMVSSNQRYRTRMLELWTGLDCDLELSRFFDKDPQRGLFGWER
jgi:hypothetical protein